MFEDVGKKIQDLSVVVFVVLLIASLVGAIVLWATLSRYVDGKFWIGFGVFVGGAVIAVVSSLMIRGFGIIVDSHENNYSVKQVENFNGTLPNYNSNLFRDMDNKKKPVGTPMQGEWMCSKCGSINQNYVGTCGCGQLKSNN